MRDSSVIMETRELGRSGLKVSALGLGCMGLTDYYGVPNVRESLATIHRALDLGINFLDTADMYGMGRNEEFIGKAIRGRREKVVLATKFGNLFDNKGTFAGVNGRSEYVRIACEASLRRLGVDVIDLYFLHRVDTNTPIEETVAAMARLVKQGKVRHIGLSEASAETLRRGHQVHPVAALQSEYSLWSREPEDEILNVCRDLGVGFVAYCPLGRGFLTGRIKHAEDLAETDTRRKSPRFQPENFQKNLALVDRVKEIARGKGCTPAQLALAWLLAQGDDIVPIPGTKRSGYLEENIAALPIKLTEDDLKTIDEIVPKGMAAGARYTQAMMSLVNR